MSRGDRQKAAARRQAAIQRATASTGRRNQDTVRDQAGARASLAPSAARILVASVDGPRSVDPVVVALSFARGLLSLQGANAPRGREATTLLVTALRTPKALHVPSGLTLPEALLLVSAELPAGDHDAAVTLAAHLTDIGTRHDDGEIDLYAMVAPQGRDRHPQADGVEMVCAAVLPEDVADDDGRPRLVLVLDDGWLEVWPPAAIEAASRGVLADAAADVVGEGLYRWLTGPDAAVIAASGVDALPAMFGGADIQALLDTSAQRAGSDHPAVAGPVLLQMLAPPRP